MSFGRALASLALVSALALALSRAPDPSPVPARFASEPFAELSCAPQRAAPGALIALAYLCRNATSSLGIGFQTGGALSGSAMQRLPGAHASTTYALLCARGARVAFARCDVAPDPLRP